MAEGNNQSDNQSRQKQDIQKLLSGQSLSSSPPTSSSDSTTNITPSSSSIPSTESNITTTTPPLREDKLTLAISFLSSPKVQAADKTKKTAFLKQKGLTNLEIEEAYRRTSSTTAQTTTTSSQVTIPTATKHVSPTPASTLPPVVPTRAPTTRPTQIVYYSSPDPERLTGKRMMALALIFGAGAVGLTAGLVSIVKVLISPIFNSIGSYQRNRYNDRHDKLLRLSDTLRQQLTHEEEEDKVDDDDNGSFLMDDETSTTTKSTTGYWSSLIKEQKSLMDRLDQLVRVSQKHVADEQEPFGKFKNTLLDLKEVLNRPEYNFSTYTPYSMYGSTFANRSNTGFDDSAVQGVKSEIRSFKGMLLSRRNFPAAQIKPLPSVVPAAAKDKNKTEADTANTASPPPPATAAVAAPTTTSATSSYHPRQRQNSYRAELQAKAQAAETSTTPDQQQPTLVDGSSQPNAGDKVVSDTKGKSMVIEDITEANTN